MQSIGVTSNPNAPAQIDLFFIGMTFLLPASIMAMNLGNMLIGEEGKAVWRIYASPISPKNLVKSKLFFLTSLSILILIVTETVGTIFYHPSIRVIIAGFIEGFLLVLALGSIVTCNRFQRRRFHCESKSKNDSSKMGTH